MKTKAIIPCAGRGSRMNMKENESKELLPLYYGRPLIENTLELCSIFQLEPHVVTRKEKTDLIDYCNQRGVTVQIIEPKGEWPETVLASCIHWNENNILLLPDTIFSPISVLEQIKLGLECGSSAVLAVHDVPDIRQWGSVSNYFLTEKSEKEMPGKAWGVIGFNNVHGVKLFQAMSKKNEPYRLRDTGFVGLSSFTDVTRGDKKDMNEKQST